MEVTPGEICLRNCIHQRIHNTVADAISRLEYNPESILGYPPRVIVGKASQHYGVLITRRTQARMDKTAI
jgi:hypothetical protein